MSDKNDVEDRRPTEDAENEKVDDRSLGELVSDLGTQIVGIVSNLMPLVFGLQCGVVARSIWIGLGCIVGSYLLTTTWCLSVFEAKAEKPLIALSTEEMEELYMEFCSRKICIAFMLLCAGLRVLEKTYVI